MMSLPISELAKGDAFSYEGATSVFVKCESPPGFPANVIICASMEGDVLTFYPDKIVTPYYLEMLTGPKRVGNDIEIDA